MARERNVPRPRITTSERLADSGIQHVPEQLFLRTGHIVLLASSSVMQGMSDNMTKTNHPILGRALEKTASGMRNAAEYRSVAVAVAVVSSIILTSFAHLVSDPITEALGVFK